MERSVCYWTRAATSEGGAIPYEGRAIPYIVNPRCMTVPGTAQNVSVTGRH